MFLSTRRPLTSGLNKFSRTLGRVNFDPEAREIWKSIYSDLSEGHPGLFGAVTSRAEAQVVRLALIYALTDASPEIRRERRVLSLQIGANVSPRISRQKL